ncbi:MAG: hypothetical protein EWV62_12780 [Microcystis aeruginosa Ma_OC_LR_19540900_S633]|nr:MAG: hypothetical protein EWV62_12780 [Microcystis aeruginosa Ma_OC_LR_19540900_S633]
MGRLHDIHFRLTNGEAENKLSFSTDLQSLPVGASHFCKSTKLGFLRGNSWLKSGFTFDFIT